VNRMERWKDGREGLDDILDRIGDWDLWRIGDMIWLSAFCWLLSA
jgi:hypothetical protein